MKEKIYSLDLFYGGAPASFVMKSMEAIELEQGGFVDDPHRHNFYSIIWSFTATGKHIIDFHDYPIEPRAIFFVSPWQVHQVITDPGANGLVILFTPEFLQKNSIREDFISNLRLFRDSDETPPLLPASQVFLKLKTFASAMQDAFESGDEMRFETIGAYLKLFLIECNGQCTLFPDSSPQVIEVGRSLVHRFKVLVEQHFPEWHQVQDYAKELNVSPGYLNEVISSTIHKPAKEYILNRLILETKRLSLFTAKSNKEIGYDLGFEDPSHFSKFFKTFTGNSINEFREMHHL
ncbi:MAG: helix-turn-helix transcriptional regulator [Bacteroidetes bacterium]|nr:helix-turn-helix transcriptional regulator [Bacteroidota bacterium]